MKKPIDPNLNTTESEDILFGGGYKEPDKIDEKSSQESSNVNVQMPEIKALVEKEVTSKEPIHHHHHHHSSSGEHHHSHSSGHHHYSSHRHSSKKRRKKKMNKSLKVFLIILLIITLLISSLGGTYAYLKNQGKTDFTSAVINDNNHEEIITYKGHKYAFNENVVSIAFMGVDQRDLQSKKDADFVGCADADVVVTVDTSDGTVKIINIPRDTMVDIDVYNDTGVFLSTDNVQLCLAYAYGDGKTKSCENVTKAISSVTK